MWLTILFAASAQMNIVGLPPANCGLTIKELPTDFSPLPKPFLVGWLNTFGGLHQLVGGPNALGDRQGALRRKKAVLQIERMRLESKANRRRLEEALVARFN